MTKEKQVPTLRQIVASAHTALLVVDMQHDFCSPGGALANLGVEMSAIKTVVPKLIGFVTEARRCGITIVHVWTERGPEDISGPQRELWHRRGVEVEFCRRHTWGAGLMPGLTPEEGDFSIIKTRYSAFIGTDMDAQLRSRGINTLVITGVATNVCVESTCRHAYMLDYFVVVPEDLVASGSPARHEATLWNLDHYFGRVVDSEMLLKTWHDA